jgi:chromosome segregation protein
MASRYIKLEGRIKERVTKLEKKVRVAELRVKKLETYRKRLEDRESSLEDRKNKVIMKLSEIRLEEMKEELERLEEEEKELVGKVMSLNLKISEVSKEITGELEPKVRMLEESIKTGDERLEEIGLELVEINRHLTELRQREEELEKRREEEEEKVTKFTPTLNKLELDLREVRERERRLEESIWRMEREKVRVQADIDRVTDEIEFKSKELKELNVQEIPEYHTGLSALLSELEGELSLLYGAVNQLAKQAYKEAYTSYKLASVRRRELEKDRNAIVRFIEEVESEKKRTFMAAFEKIDREVRKIFNKLTDGEGWLELENEEDPFSGGVFLMVKFPEKTAKEASSVSGGEKTVSAVSFLLALQAAYPSPFYLLDEVDMNLDPMYTEKLGQLLREWAEDTQLIVITLKDLMTAKAHNIIGVYATGGISNVVRYKLEKEGVVK